MVKDTSLIIENTPPCLRVCCRWVAWQHEERDGKMTKVPCDAKTGRRASSTDPSTWTTFEQAVEAFAKNERYDGVGYVFSAGDPFCGVDLDDSLDPATNELKPWAREIVERLSSYTEVSPSGHGVKVFLRARKSGDRCRRKYHDGEVEMYDTGRFFTVTGQRLDSVSADVESRQAELDDVYRTVFGETQTTPAPAPPHAPEPAAVPDLSDDDLIRLACSSRKGGAKFTALWDGRWNDFFNSASEADSSVIFTLAFYTKDAAQIDRLFRRSKLYRPKWDEVHGAETYGRTTIAKALEKVTGQYRPRRRRPAPSSPPRGREAANVPADASPERPEVFLPGGPAPILEPADQLGRLLAVTGRYFIRGGATVTLGRDDDDQPILAPVKSAALASRFETVARLKEFAKDHGQFIEVEAICTEQDAKLIQHAAPFQEAMPPIRLLSQCPVLAERDGALVQICGYDRASGIMAFGEPAPEVPLQEAVALLADLLVDFRFASPADHARALAALVTPALVFGRLLKGRAPIDLGEADQSQTGKGYRNKIGTAIYRSVARMPTAVPDDEEVLII